MCRVNRRSLLLGAVFLCVLPRSAVARQQWVRPYSPDEQRWLDSGWREDVAFTGANAIIAGGIAGLARWFRGGEFLDGFAWGAVGGAAAFVGRRVAAESFTAAGLLGREINAVGASVTRNAWYAESPTQEFWLPLGPAWLIVTPRSERHVRLGVDLYGVLWSAVGALRSSDRLDWGASLESGTAVFRTKSSEYNGYVHAETIFVSETPDEPVADVLAHERAHILQGDFLHITAGQPLEGWLRKGAVDGAPGLWWMTGLDRPVFRTLLGAGWLSRSWDPMEVEATYLEVR